MYLKIKIEQKSIAQSTERIGFFVMSMRSADANRLTVSFTGRDFSGNAVGNPDKKYHPLLGSPDLNFKAREIEAQTTTSDKVLIDRYLRSVMFEKGMRGFELSRDEYGKWLLEIDRIVARISLTVPELVRNRVTVANNQTWFTDNGIIEAVEAVEFKPKEKIVRIAIERGGGSTFELDDLLRGVYLDDTNDGFEFQTVLMTVREVITPYSLRVSLDENTPPPREELIVVRTGNRTNTKRQNSIFIDGARPAMFYYVNVASHTIGVDNIVQATGNLCGYNFGALTKHKEITERFTNIIRGSNYQEGNFVIRSGNGLSYPMPADRGAWIDIDVVDGVRKCYHYDRVSHRGSIWDCAVSETTSEPSDDSYHWTKRVERGTDGVNGKDAIIIDLTNQTSTVNVNSNGQVVGTLQGTKAIVYKGSQVDSGWIFEKSDTGCVSNISATTGVVVIESLLSDVAKVSITARKSGYAEMVAEYTITKSYPGTNGTNGQDAVSYWLVPAVDKIQKAASGTLIPSVITCAKMKQIGASTPITATDRQLYYQLSTGEQTAYIGAVPIGSAKWIEFVLKDGATVLDRERVPVVADGMDGRDGAQGPQGVAGTPGRDGVVYYTWIRYADTSAGEGISNQPDGKKYIGFAYNKTSQIESNTPADYAWSLIAGAKGDTGVPGAKGADGQTLYTWIKYSDNADGTGLYDTPTTTTKYIGIAVNKTTATESAVKTDYTWSKFRGEDGARGLQGLQGAKGDQGIAGPKGTDGSTSYFHIKYAPVQKPTAAQMTETPGAYIGTYVDFTAADSGDPAKYTWARFEGLQGASGESGIPGKNGANGQTSYLHIKYSDDGATFTAANGETPGSWIGQYTDFTEADSTVFAKYSWTKVKGEQGTDGASPVVYSLAPSCTAVHEDKAGVKTPATVSARAVLSIGADREVIGVDAKIDFAGRNYILGSMIDKTLDAGQTDFFCWLPLSEPLVVGQRYVITATTDGDYDQPNLSQAVGNYIETYKVKFNEPFVALYPSGSVRVWHSLQMAQGRVSNIGLYADVSVNWQPAPEDYTIQRNGQAYVPGAAIAPTNDTIWTLHEPSAGAVVDTETVPLTLDGIDGANAPRLKVQFSVDGSTAWHDTYASSDRYRRESNDNGTTWGAAMRMWGETGQQGADGKKTPYTDFSYAYGITQPTVWSDAPPAKVEGQHLWERIQKYTPKADNSGWNLVSTSYAIINEYVEVGGVNRFINSDLEIGVITAGIGSNAAAANRFRNKSFVPLSSSQITFRSFNESYQYAVFFYDKDNGYINDTYKMAGNTWLDYTAPRTYSTPAGTKFIRYTSRKVNDSIITIADFKAAKFMIVAGNRAPDVWSPSPEDVQADIDAAKTTAENARNSATTANSSVAGLKNFTDTAFADGVISRAERASIEKYKNAVNESWADFEASYTVVYQNVYLEGSTAKTELLNAKISLAGAKDQLLTAITSAIADGVTTPAEVANVNAKYTAYNNLVAPFKTALENANKAIQTKLDTLANGYADGVKETRVSLEHLDQNTYYPVRLQLSAEKRANILMTTTLGRSAKPAWARHANGFSAECEWRALGDGWGALTVSREILRVASSWTVGDVSPFGSINQMTYSSQEYIYLRGGGVYFFRTTNVSAITLTEESYTHSGQTIAPRATVESVVTDKAVLASKADAAKAEALAAETRTKAYADGKITTAEANAIAKADQYAKAAKEAAEITAASYADGKITTAEARAMADATAKANAACEAAITAAGEMASEAERTAKIEAITSFFGGTMGGATTDEIMEALEDGPPLDVIADGGKRMVVASNLFAKNLAAMTAFIDTLVAKLLKADSGFIDQLIVNRLKTVVEGSSQRVEAANNQLLIFDDNNKVCASLTGEQMPPETEFKADGSQKTITVAADTNVAHSYYMNETLIAVAGTSLVVPGTSQLKITGTLTSFITGFNPPSGSKIATSFAKLYLYKNGVRYQTISQSTASYNNSEVSEKIETMISVPAGTYDLRISASRGPESNNYTGNARLSAGATFGYDFVVNNVQAMFRSGGYGIRGNRYNYEHTSFDPNYINDKNVKTGLLTKTFRGEFDAPYVALAGYDVASGGATLHRFGAKALNGLGVTNHIGYGEYLIKHNIGHTMYNVVPIVTAGSRGGTNIGKEIRSQRTATSCVVCFTNLNNDPVQSDFTVTIFGKN